MTISTFKRMILNQIVNKLALFALIVLSVFSCASSNTLPEKSACYIIFDAGSSGTRLYVYQQIDLELIAHEGPKVSALADPIRSIRGKTPAHIEAVTNEVVSSLDLIMEDAPLIKGKPKWEQFDWNQQCDLVSTKVYATAGMRIAEQNNPADSIILWQTLTSKIAAKVGPNVTVETRTLTGFEEGLFAWLSVKDVLTTGEHSSYYGIVEMGGASSQITFPCPNCDSANDAVKTVTFNGNSMQIYSYSYLGLGQDEAPYSLPFAVAGQVPASCSYGIGVNLPDWNTANCAKEILLTTEESNPAIADPYNYSNSGKKGTSNRLPPEQQDIPEWRLTGAFNYVKETDIDECCINKNASCYQTKTACFKPIYLNKYLETLNITPEQSRTLDVSWTKGAAICQVENCLANITTSPVCRWMKSGCLTQ